MRDGDVAGYAAQDSAVHRDGVTGRTAGGVVAHRHRRSPPRASIEPDDTVVLSARAIPGNEKAISRVMNHVTRRGADIVTESMKHVHVSGHGSEEELKLMLSLVRPRYLVPVHGEYRQLRPPQARCRTGDRQYRARSPGAARRERRRAAIRPRWGRRRLRRHRRGGC